MVETYHSSLRAFRRKTPLTISDISFLLNRKDTSSLSRYEKGRITPPNEILLAYMILFDVSLREVLRIQHQEIGMSLTNKIPELIEVLTDTENRAYRQCRIEYLQQSFDRLSNEVYVQK